MNTEDFFDHLLTLSHEEIKDDDDKFMKHLKMFSKCWYKEIVDKAYECRIKK